MDTNRIGYGINPSTLHVLARTYTIIVASIKDTADSGAASDTSTKPDFTLSSHHPSPVAMAVELKNIELLELLIEKGASVDIADDDGETALLLAIRNGFLDGVKILIESGHANVDHSEKINGVTPLMVAGKAKKKRWKDGIGSGRLFYFVLIAFA